jgi:hypothetical protein
MDLKIETKTAVMIEPRRHKAIKFVLENFLECLDESWSIIVVIGNSNYEYVQNITKSINSNRIKIINMNLPNLNALTYSRLLMTPAFYNIVPTEIFMIFQTDSMINKNNKHLLDQFLKYDYVGAPWYFGGVGNGGLSLRKKSKMLEVIHQYGLKNCHEDVYFANYPGLYKPDFETAKQFAIETVFHESSFGVHNCWGHLPNKVEYFKQTIPGFQKLMELQCVEDTQYQNNLHMSFT